MLDARPWGRDRDTDSVARARAGDLDAFETLILRHQQRAHAVARAHGTHASNVDDVVQESFLLAFRNLHRLRDARRFSPWLLAIVRNAARRAHRARGAARSVALDDDHAAPTAADPIEASELRDHLARRVAGLSPAVREAISLYYYEGRSVRDVARALDVSRAAVRKRLQDGRDALRGTLWRELEAELCDMLPSAREWRRRARALSLLAVAALGTGDPTSGATPDRASASRAEPPAPTDGAAATAVSNALLTGVAIMTTKKIAVAATVALTIALGSLWLANASRSSRDNAGDEISERPATITASADAPRAAPEPDAPRVEAAPNADDATASVEPAPRPALVLRVVNSDGEPIDDAVLQIVWYRRVLDPDGTATFTPVSRDGIIGRAEFVDPTAPGEFVLAERVGDRLNVSAAARHHVPTSREIEVPESGLDEPVDVELRYIGMLEFRIVAPLDGDRPVAGATVGWIDDVARRSIGAVRGFPPMDLDARARVIVVDRVTSDADGNVAIGFARSSLWVKADGFGPTAVRTYADNLDDASQRHAIPIYPPTTLEISVSRIDGAHVDAFRYSLVEEYGPAMTRGFELAGPSFRRRADEDRVTHEIFHVCRMSPDAQVAKAITIAVSADGLEARKRVDLDLGRVNAVDIVLDPTHARIAGRVLSEDGSPVADAKVTALRDQERLGIYDDKLSGRGGSTARTSSDGSYLLELSAQTRSATLVVEHPDHPLHMGDRLVVGAGTLVHHDVVLPRPATVRVTLAERVLARAGEDVSLTNENMDCYPLIDYRRSVPLRPDGAATFDNVHAGPWILHWTEDSIIRRQPITVAAGREYDVVLGELNAAVAYARVTGALVARGRAVQGVSLYLWEGSHHLGLLAKTTTGDNGEFGFEDVPIGRRRLGIAFGQRLPELPLRYIAVDIDAAATPLLIDVTTSTLSGRVFSAGGRLADVKVRPLTRQHTPGGERWTAFSSVETDAAGEFRLPGVYQTPALLAFEKDGYATRRVPWQPDGAEEIAVGDVFLEEAGGGGLSFRLVDAESGAPITGGLIEIETVIDDCPLSVATLRPNDDEASRATGPLAPGRYRVRARAGDVSVFQYVMETIDIDHDGSQRELEVRCRPGGSVSLTLASDDGLVPATARVEVRDASGAVLPAWNGEPSLAFSGSTMLLGLPLEGVTARVTADGWKPADFAIRPLHDRVLRITQTIERDDRR